MVLFAALTPGVLFTIPSLGKKMGGKVAIAAMHAVLFVIVVNLLNVVQEGFQASNTKEDIISLNASLKKANADLNAMDKQIMTDTSSLRTHTDASIAIQKTIAAIQAKINAINKQNIVRPGTVLGGKVASVPYPEAAQAIEPGIAGKIASAIGVRPGTVLGGKAPASVPYPEAAQATAPGSAW